MLDFNLGVINEVGVRLGILIRTAMPWLAQPGTAMAAVILAVVWQGFPFFAVTLLAGLQAIPRRAVRSRRDRRRRAASPASVNMTLPGLAGVIATALLLRMIWVANSFDLILVMTGGGPGTATQTLPLTRSSPPGPAANYGYGSALAVVLTLLLLAWSSSTSVRNSAMKRLRLCRRN